MSDFSGDQVHPASPLREQQARRDGDNPKSFELANAIQTLIALGAAFLMLGGLAKWLHNWTVETWTNAAGGIVFDAGATTQQMQNTAFSFATVLAPILVLMFVAGILAHWSQTGIVFLPGKAAPDLQRLGPQKWWSQIFSFRSFSGPVLGIPKTMVAIGGAGASCWYQSEKLFSLSGLPVEQIGPQTYWLVLTVGLHVAAVLFALALCDLAIQRWSFQRRLRMTDQEIRDETRMQGSNPQVSSRRKSIHRSYGRT